ncbi:hypothetical protein VEE71_00220 [Escherichia coli]|nr:hypothetical protein VEGS02_00220 [Escherichia coli]BED11299.1 hypothetical protein VEE71_00220 [Escherichia coli]
MRSAADWKHGNATAFWSVVWILQILNGRKCRNKLYELTYLWHRVNPNLTVRSVPAAEVYNMFMEFGVKSIN